MRNDGGCDFPLDPEAPPDQKPFWSPEAAPQVITLSPVDRGQETDTSPIVLTDLDQIELRHAPDGWHGLWTVNGTTHQIWLPEGRPDAASCYSAILPLDAFLELRTHAARRFWRSLAGRPPGPPPDALPDQRRHWHILSLRALDARLTGESHRGIAAGLLGFRGRKEDFEIDPCRNRVRRLIAHGVRMMHGDYRHLLHYPVRLDRC